MEQDSNKPSFPAGTLFVLGATLALVCWLRHDALDTYWQQTRHGELGLTGATKDPLWVEGVQISNGVASGIDSGNRWLDMVGGRVTLATNIVLTGPEAPPAATVAAAPVRSSLVPSTALATLPKLEAPKAAAPDTAAAAPATSAEHNFPPLSDDGRIVLTQQDKVLLVGDSMMQGVAPHVARALQKANIASLDLSKQSTGLAYPTYFDWPATVQKAIPDSGITVMVVFLGANDTWDIFIGGRAERFGSDKWQSVYAQRIDSMVKFAESQNVRVIWLGAPNMGREKINSGVKILNHLYQSENNDGLARYVSTRELLSGGDDTDVYQKHITIDGGKTVTVRTDDGVHFTRTGQEMLSNLILRQFALPMAAPPASAVTPAGPSAAACRRVSFRPTCHCVGCREAALLMAIGWKSIAVLAATLTLSPAPQAANLINYGDVNAPHLWGQLSALEHGYGEDVRVVQLGDSHTGGDYFTQALREQMQRRFGSGGIGWLTPGYIKNQRSAQALMRMTGQWATRVSHSEPGNFPLGGLVNQASSGAAIEIAPKIPLTGLLRVSIWTRRANDAPSSGWTLTFPDGETRELPPAYDSDWHVSYVIGNAADVNSLFLRAGNNPPELGGIAVDTVAHGVTVDTLGIVGAVQKVITNWQPEAVREELAWRKPDLIILSYGTNEAFDPRFDPEVYRADLRRTIRELREAAPEAAVLLIGAPDAGKKTGRGDRVGCRYDLPPALRAVQDVQHAVAREERLLYWDWATAMGGRCAMQHYADANPALGRPDLVHFTEEGYARSGTALFQALMESYVRSR